jgi:hypothetical protein
MTPLSWSSAEPFPSAARAVSCGALDTTEPAECPEL